MNQVECSAKIASEPRIWSVSGAAGSVSMSSISRIRSFITAPALCWPIDDWLRSKNRISAVVVLLVQQVGVAAQRTRAGVCERARLVRAQSISSSTRATRSSTRLSMISSLVLKW